MLHVFQNENQDWTGLAFKSEEFVTELKLILLSQGKISEQNKRWNNYKVTYFMIFSCASRLHCSNSHDSLCFLSSSLNKLYTNTRKELLHILFTHLNDIKSCVSICQHLYGRLYKPQDHRLLLLQ